MKDSTGVINSLRFQLQSLGIGKQAIDDNLLLYRREIEKLANSLCHLSGSYSGMVAGLILMDVIISKSNRPHYKVYHYKNQLAARLNTVLKGSPDRSLVADCYYRSRRQFSELYAQYQPLP